ncbi:MAG TPA: response regulator [Thermoanaerobaculia bacterium]|nr:response regulator [Thermoanaerobaculia bacterium]
MSKDGRARALLIEPDERYLRMLCDLCEEESLVPESASEGREAIRLLDGDDYALIVLDLQVPGLDGFSIIDFLRERKPALLERVVVFTGFENVREVAPEVPAVPKPNLGSLRYAIRRVIGADRAAN